MGGFRKALARPLLPLLLALLLLSLAGMAGGFLAFQLLFRTNATAPVDFVVAQGQPVQRVLQNLEKQGLVPSSFALGCYRRLFMQSSTVKAGEYRLSGELSPLDILQILAKGQVKQYFVTLLEGWTFKDIRRQLGQTEYLTAASQDMSSKEIMQRLGRPDTSPEGQFFPDTYTYTRGSDDLQLLRRSMQRMQQVLAEEWAERSRNLPFRHPEEALILASMIEEETGHPNDREKIAGVFVRRLKLGIKLQSDPTVIYGLGERFDGDLKRSHLKADTPWNTYVRRGLPPTPIAAPGRASIRAALNPDDSDNLYFVAMGGGRSAFSSSLKEHNAAVRRYQLKQSDEAQ